MNLSKNLKILNRLLQILLTMKLKLLNGVKILDNDFPGFKNQRNFVQWLFSNETSINDFKRFDISNGGYLIVQVTGTVEEGLSSVQDASYRILPEVIKSKKAEYIILKENRKYMSIG